jgi:hypothetical protein
MVAERILAHELFLWESLIGQHTTVAPKPAGSQEVSIFPSPAPCWSWEADMERQEQGWPIPPSWHPGNFTTACEPAPEPGTGSS